MLVPERTPGAGAHEHRGIVLDAAILAMGRVAPRILHGPITLFRLYALAKALPCYSTGQGRQKRPTGKDAFKKGKSFRFPVIGSQSLRAISTAGADSRLGAC